MQSLNGFDLEALAVELSVLRKAMRQEAEDTTHDKAVIEIGGAMDAARGSDVAGVLMHLKAAGGWALDVATKIGVNLASEALKKSMSAP